MTIKRKILLILVLAGVSLTTAGGWLGAAALYGAYLYLNPRLPNIESLKDVRMQEPLRVYSREGRLIAEFGEKRRIPIMMADVPERVRQAFLAAEDERFMQHPGVDYRGLLRAAINQVITGDKSQGGSTITMQVARNFFLTREKTYVRKLNEIFLALKIDKELSKDTILELYLNKIFFGKRAWGIAAAAQVYYGKTLNELTLPQIAMIAGLPKAPSAFNPIVNPQRALSRRNYVLGRMRDLKYISAEEYAEAVSAPVTAQTHEVMVEVEASYVAEMVRSDVVERYGEETAYTGGIKVYTTLDGALQAAANRAVQNGLLDYEARHGYKGPIRRLNLPSITESIAIQPELNPVAPDDSLLVDEEGEIVELPAVKTVEVATSVVPTPIYTMPQHEADSLIGAIGRFANIQPGLVLAITTQPAPAATDTAEKDEKTETAQLARVYLGKGQTVELNFDAVQWASPYISVNETGKEPQKLSDVLKVGDLIWVRNGPDGAVRLAQLPGVEGALVALDPRNGAIVSLVGGFDFTKSKFNRATQAKRQPGSGFKPFIYSAALEQGFTAASIINDAPVVFDDPALEGKWRPENYSGKFYGDTRLREALTHSRNLVSIRLLIALGIRPAREFAKRFGFNDEALPRDLSLALGSGTLTPLELVSGFAVFANGGYKIKPFFIDRIEDTEGRVLQLAEYQLACLQCFVDQLDPEQLQTDYTVEWPAPETELQSETGSSDEHGDDAEAGASELPVDPESEVVAEAAVEAAIEPTTDLKQADGTPSDVALLPMDDGLPYVPPKRLLKQAPQIVEPRIIYIMDSILRDVVRLGTGRGALALGRGDLSGKTGTSNDERDAWFNGFNQKYVASVWVGYDGHQPLGRREPGGRAALPIWVDFMRTALQDVPEETPKQPEGIVTLRIDAQTGLLANAATAESMFEIFRVENAPTEQSEQSIPGFSSEIPGEESGSTVTEELF